MKSFALRASVVFFFASLTLASRHPACAQQTLWRLDDPGGYGFGGAVAGAGDVDGDGSSDLLIGCGPYAIYGGAVNQVFVMSGESGSFLRILSPERSIDTFGLALDSVGDVNGDGVPDILVSGALRTPTGTELNGIVHCYSGAAGERLYYIVSPPGIGFGQSLVGIGDIDGDGAGDFAVGAPGASANGAGSGSCYVYSGSSGALVYSLDGDAGYDALGSSIAAGGDVSGDGIPDILVGAPGNDNAAGFDAGAIYLFSGKSGAKLQAVIGEAAGDQFGSKLGGNVDLNGDGYMDVIASAVHHNGSGGYYKGRAYTLLGPNLTINSVFDGAQFGDDYGKSVAGVGDVDGDFYEDFAIGSDNASSYISRVEVHSGKDGSIIYSENGDSPSASFPNFGQSIARVGDVSGDGLADLVVGEPTYYPYNTSWDGTVFVYSNNSPPRIQSLTPERADYPGGTQVTVHGQHFSQGTNLQVLIGSNPASNAVIVDDKTITCDVPACERGLTNVTLTDSEGKGTLTNGFTYTPAIAPITGDLEPGGNIVIKHFCDPGDGLFGIFGLPPEVSLPTPPYTGNLCILPFFISFIVPSWSFDEYTVDSKIPNDPTLSGVTVNFQALIGPGLTGKVKNAAWTNCAAATFK